MHTAAAWRDSGSGTPGGVGFQRASRAAINPPAPDQDDGDRAQRYGCNEGDEYPIHGFLLEVDFESQENRWSVVVGGGGGVLSTAARATETARGKGGWGRRAARRTIWARTALIRPVAARSSARGADASAAMTVTAEVAGESITSL